MITELALPLEIITQIIGYLPDCQILSLYRDIPILASNPLYLPILKNNYNYYCNDFELTEKLLERGFKISVVVGDNQMMTRLFNNVHCNQIYKLKIQNCKINNELYKNLCLSNKFNNLYELTLHNPLNDNSNEYFYVRKKLEESRITILDSIHVDSIYMEPDDRYSLISSITLELGGDRVYTHYREWEQVWNNLYSG